jgi:hypothetical protein
MITNSNHLVPGWKSIKQPYQKGVSCHAPKTNSQLANHRAPNECVFICETVQKAATAVCRIKRAALWSAHAAVLLAICIWFEISLILRFIVASVYLTMNIQRARQHTMNNRLQLFLLERRFSPHSAHIEGKAEERRRVFTSMLITTLQFYCCRIWACYCAEWNWRCSLQAPVFSRGLMPICAFIF